MGSGRLRRLQKTCVVRSPFPNMTPTPTQSVVLMGRPGSGKGTQAKRLSERTGWTHFSTGERFKQLREGEGAVATSIRGAYDSGKLIPDWFANYLFEGEVLSLKETDGIVFDGYPRSRAQAEIFENVLGWLSRPYLVLDLVVSPEEVTKRMLLRAQEEFRPDSANEEQIRVRLATYDEHTAPVLAFFKEQGRLVEIDGTGTPEEVEAAIVSALSL